MNIVKVLFVSCSFFGLFFMIISNTSRTIYQTGYRRKGWRKYRNGYSIKEIKKVIEISDDEVIKNRLRKGIIFRRLGYFFLLLVPFIVILEVLFGRE